MKVPPDLQVPSNLFLTFLLKALRTRIRQVLACSAPWILFKQLTDCRRINDHIDEEIPNCPLAADITAAIEDDPSVPKKLSAATKAMCKISDWARGEGLLHEKKDAKRFTTCYNCLHEIYKQSQEAVGSLVSFECEFIFCINYSSFIDPINPPYLSAA